MKIAISILLVTLFSCQSNKSKDLKQVLDFGVFSIETPNGWTKMKRHGIDSYTGMIAIDANDTLHFNLGIYANTLTEHEPQIVERTMLKHFANPGDTLELIIVESRYGVDADKYKKNNISWDTIDKHKAKIVFPIRSSFGTTGVYIDSLWLNGSEFDRFNLYGDNLSALNEKLVLKALKTIRFHDKR